MKGGSLILADSRVKGVMCKHEIGTFGQRNRIKAKTWIRESTTPAKKLTKSLFFP